MTTISLYNATMLVFYLLFQISIYSNTTTSKLIGFSTDLIHKDSLKLSSYNRYVNGIDLLSKTISHSRSRLSYLKYILKLHNNQTKETTDIESTTIESFSSYLMEIYVGTPPTKQMVSVDTGSSMSWIQCLPCEHCFKQNQHIFNSNRSSSYQVLRCDSSECLKLGRKRDCTRSNEKCKYRLSYDDKAGSSGELAKETYTVGDTSIPNIAHGCGHKNRGNFSEQSTGMIGLADGPISFFGQIRYLTGGKFSYCLVSQFGSNTNARSRISFGKNAVVSGSGVISTPLSKKKNSPFYLLTLKSISVQNIIIPFPFRKSIIPFIRRPGNIIIDSGTTINYFPSDVLRNLKTALIRVIGKTPFNIADELCYEINTDIPNIIFHFASNANLTLSKMNTFTVYGNVLCLDMKQDDGISIFGNRSQMNFLVGYDIPRKKVSFKSTDCSRYMRTT